MGFLQRLFGSTPERTVAPTQSFLDEMASSTDVSITDQTPSFNLKRNEIFLQSIPCELWTHRANANVGFAIASQRVKLWKGFSVRVGGGKVARGKSWQKLDHGILNITNNRIIFNGSTKNSTQLHTKILNIIPTKKGDGIHVNRESGPDWKFQFNNKITPTEMRTIILASKLTKEVLSIK